MQPTVCGKCGASLQEQRVRGEQWDPKPGVWVGFVDCPACGTVYVFTRKGPPPAREDT